MFHYMSCTMEIMATDENGDREGQGIKDSVCRVHYTCKFYYSSSPRHRRSIKIHHSFVGLIIFGVGDSLRIPYYEPLTKCSTAQGSRGLLLMNQVIRPADGARHPRCLVPYPAKVVGEQTTICFLLCLWLFLNQGSTNSPRLIIKGQLAR